LNENGNGDGSCSDGDGNSPRTAELMREIGGMLEGFGDTLNVGGVNGDSAGVSGMCTEGERLELIDRVLGCEEVEGIYEDHSTLTVSFSSWGGEQEEMGMR
jgi:hypothetical protein